MNIAAMLDFVSGLITADPSLCPRPLGTFVTIDGQHQWQRDEHRFYARPACGRLQAHIYNGGVHVSHAWDLAS